jgi:hypothetical protein
LPQLGDAQECKNVYEYSHPIEFSPSIFIAGEVEGEMVIDGRLSEEDWNKVSFSEDFVDIEGELRELPERRTRVKMLHDDKYLYVAAILEEDHIWFTLKEKDAIMYHDDDFEVFVDANGDGHNYQEFEMNAYNALWDLWLLYPYSVKSNNYLMDWEPKGVKTGVHIEGTVNDPSDIDSFWSVEIAIPIAHLGRKSDFWRINFSRVDWLMEIVNDTYVKVKDTPERNWVWSPIGHVNMHKPETWGYLAFDKSFKIPEGEFLKWEMWKLYYAIRSYKRENNSTPLDPKCFKIPGNVQLTLSKYGFDIVGELGNQKWLLNETALIKKIK